MRKGSEKEGEKRLFRYNRKEKRKRKKLPPFYQM
jgi:hypothetical protein